MGIFRGYAEVTGQGDIAPAKVPGSNYSILDFNSSVAKVRRVADMYQAQVLFGHDKDQNLPFFPKLLD